VWEELTSHTLHWRNWCHCTETRKGW
jgi:hypothetical protein